MRVGTGVLSWMCVCLLALAAGCKTEPKEGAGSAEAMGHGHGLPGIDCPLRKAGVDPSGLRPFAEVEKYIAFLDRPERDGWQRPDDVVRALDLRGDETVYDLGAGSGYFSFRLARAVPRGRVVAGDLEPEMIRHIHHKAMTTGVTNLNPVLIKAEEPQVPGEADVVFVCDVLHHVQGREAWLKRVASEMKPGARFVLVEFKEGRLPEGPPEAAKIPRKQLVELVTRAGLGFESERPELLLYQVFFVFRKGPAQSAAVPATEGAGVIAYYFHGTVRCETCLKIEERAREVISNRFQVEIAAGRLAFRSVNYDEAANAHFLSDYKLPCPSLGLVRQTGGKDRDWRILGPTWEMAQMPPKLDQYIEEEVTKLLAGEADSAAAKEEPADAVNTTKVGSFSEISDLAGEMNASFVFLPEKGRAPPANAWIAVTGAKRTLESQFGVKIGLFSLAPSSKDYEEMCAKMEVPMVAVVKTGAKKAIRGDLTKEKVVTVL